MLLGKENQTLVGHVTDCLTAMNARISLDATVLQTACTKRLQVSWEEVGSCLRFAAVMHDVGKATNIWQKEEYDRIQSGSDRSIVTHAIPSAFVASAALNLGSDVKTPKHATVLAIWGHHGQLSTSSALHDDKRPVRLLEDGWRALGSLAESSSGFTLRKFPLDKSFILGSMGQRLRGWITALPHGQDAIRFKALYCLITALLRSCDGSASQYAHGKASKSAPGGPFLNRSSDTPNLHDWRQVIEADILSGHNPNVLQSRAHELSGLCDLLNAGCGEGKTAFALRHGQELMRSGKVNRIIFTLPTRFTSNNMHKDFRNKYNLPGDIVGLFHGESRSFLKAQHDGEDEERTNLLIQNQQMQDRVYHRPVTISTVDHLLMSIYHGYKYADWAFGNVLQSLVVFDELHHYETLTASAIKETLAIFRLLNIPHLIMTATIPRTRIADLNDREPGQPQGKYTPLVSDGKEESPIPPSRVRRTKESFVFRKDSERMVGSVRDDNGVQYEASQALLDDLLLHRNRRQIVFVNQVEKAKAISKAALACGLPNICYHSEFIGRDRNAIEAQIREAFSKEEPCLLVATQIAELSLDISAHRMHTEIAPLDDIAQRGGRLHRNGVTTGYGDWVYEMIVHPLDFDSAYDILPYVNLKEHLAKSVLGSPHLLQRSWDILKDGASYRFDTVRNWVDSLYDAPNRLTHTPFRVAVQEDIVFGAKPQDRFGESGEEESGQVVLRAKEYETFDVVPMDFEGELGDDRELNRAITVKINQFKFYKAANLGLIEPRTKSVRMFDRRAKKQLYVDQRYYVLKRSYNIDFGIDFRGEPEYDSDFAETARLKNMDNVL